jgi:hypothetical protein
VRVTVRVGFGEVVAQVGFAFEGGAVLPAVLDVAGEPVKQAACPFPSDVDQWRRVVEISHEREGDEHLVVVAVDALVFSGLDDSQLDPGLAEQRGELPRGLGDRDPDRHALLGFVDQELGDPVREQVLRERVVEEVDLLLGGLDERFGARNGDRV